MSFFKSFICILIVVVGIVTSEPPSNNYGTPLAAPINSYGSPNYNVNNEHHDHGEPKSYEFGYQVKDDYSGNNYNRQESSDGNQVRGEYRVLLPDGRTQIVTYYADWQTGFHADVKYEGTAQYPEQYHQNSQYGAPNYNQGGSATSSVSIKDYSSDSTPSYQNGGYNHQNGGNNNNYDSYNSGYNKARPGYEYGAP